MASVEIDTKGMNCPIPIVKTKKALKKLEVGDEVRVEATDPGSVADFNAFCRSTGNELVDSSKDGGVYVFLIKKTN
ncbi:MAG: sulfurtransferase TusA family protein [Rhodospirillaceae bacterium]